jgi:DNA topoisomerase-1
MHLIVCEKQVAAKRIAEILSNGKCATDKKHKIPYYSFPKHLVVGLSGHVLRVDFPKKYSSWSGIPFKELTMAELVYAHDKLNIIKLVKFLAKKASDVIIATDFDTEGESIGLEAVNIVKEVKKVPVKRMHFSTITKEEILESYNNLVGLDVNLASAADARREIDIIWGAVLTRFLSVSTKRLGNSYLSAGRVQSPTLSLIVEKEKERLKFKPKPYWEFPLKVSMAKTAFLAFYHDKRVFDKKIKIKLEALKPKQALVKKIDVKEKTSKPPAPFNTTSYLREAARLGLSGVNAMRIAESLYLKGLVSYPRTDNQVYPKALKVHKVLKKFEKTNYKDCLAFLRKDLVPTKGSKETKDHPPIHPTGLRPENIDSGEQKVFDLIVRRFISTFSRDCVEETTRVRLDVEGHDFVAAGYRVVKPGWRGVYTFSNKDDNILPALSNGDSLKVLSLDCISKETQPPNRYGHGSIIKAMSDLNIGTKSTRPSIVQKLINRYYVFNSKSLAPTPVAMAVMNALDSYANIITESSMTRELEDAMEGIADGKLTKESVVLKSRKLLLNALKVLLKNQDVIAEEIRKSIHASRILGPCPKCGEDMLIRTSRRSGKRFVGCSGYPKCENSYPLPQYGLLQLTNNVCKHCKIKNAILIRKTKRPFRFCPNLECPSRKEEKATKS